MNITIVYINGVLQIPGIDYRRSPGSISFQVPPCAQADIIISQLTPNTEGEHIIKLTGDGSTFLFPVDFEFVKRAEIEDLFNDIREYRSHTAVVDVLERLRVVIALVKQE